MKNILIRFALRVLVILAIGVLVAIGCWYYFKPLVSVDTIVFWCGIATIMVGIIIFAGHSAEDLAPRDFDNASAIDPEDMSTGQALVLKAESMLVALLFAGFVLIGASIVLYAI